MALHHDLVEVNWDTGEAKLIKRVPPSNGHDALGTVERYAPGRRAPLRVVMTAAAHSDDDCPFWNEDTIQLSGDYDPWRGRPDA